MESKYYIDEVNLSTYGITVTNSKGMLDMPKMKTPYQNDWKDGHGVEVDLSNPKFEPREITLDCWMVATDKVDFVSKVQSFYAAMTLPGTRKLVCRHNVNKPMLFDVYCKDGISIDKKTAWNQGKQAGSFAIKFIEPEPIKKVFRFVATEGDMTARINVNSTAKLYIDWFDGQNQMASGSNALVHEYETEGEKLITFRGYNQSSVIFPQTPIELIWSL